MMSECDGPGQEVKLKPITFQNFKNFLDFLCLVEGGVVENYP